MSRYTGPKNRIARKLGVNVFGKLRNPLLHKPNGPGMHGAKRKKKSDFGLQMDEKQKLAAVYGMLTKKQLVSTYKKALKERGNTAHVFLSILETRLDNIVYRLRFAPTIFGAHQMVSHGHILVNGKKVDRRSFRVKPGMEISIKEKSRTKKFTQLGQDRQMGDLPEYLSIENPHTGKLVTQPEFDQISLPLPINVALVCEFLAHTT
jgi:small subunit ribosomal protein S4